MPISVCDYVFTKVCVCMVVVVVVVVVQSDGICLLVFDLRKEVLISDSTI